MNLPGLCLTFMMFLSIHGDRLDSLETKIDAFFTYIQTDLLLLKQNVNNNHEQISELADLVNKSMLALTRKQYTPAQGITSTKVTPNTDSEHMPDLKINILQLQSDMKRIRRATYEEKRYGRQVYLQLKNANTDLQTSVQSVLQNQMNQEIKMTELFKHIDTRVNISAYEISEMQTQIKDTIIENQMKLKTKMNVSQTKSNADLNHLHSDLIETLTTMRVVSQVLSNNTHLLEGTEMQCIENRNHIQSAKLSIETQLMGVKIEVMKGVRPNTIYSHDRNARLDNVTYLNDFSVGGRLEVYHGDEWGTVCDDLFNGTDATVACREFGYANGKHHGTAYYGQGQGKTWLDNLKCTGSESNIRDCSHAGWGLEDCSHREDVGVTCF